MLDSFKQRLDSNPTFKAFVHRLLIPKGQARPRLWVKWFLNPFIHHRKSGSSIGKGVRMDVLPFQAFSLGKGSTIEDYSVINNGVGAVHIGDDVRVGIGNTVMGPVSIGNETIIGQHVLITGLDHIFENPQIPIKHQGVKTAPVVIGRGCFIGANVCIMPGVHIGNNAVIGAGSVVTKNVPDFHVAVGNPAKLRKYYDINTESWIKI